MSGPSEEDPAHPLFRAWTAAARIAMRYFSYRVDGLEHLDGETALIVAYHPGPFPWDNFMLWTALYDRTGAPPRMIAHHLYHRVPAVRALSQAIGFLDGAPSAELIASLRRRRQHLFVAPGGTREGLRPFWRARSVDWGGRTGFLKLARTHRLPIVPVASAATENTYLGLVDGYALSRRLFGHGGMPLWTGVGLGGLWPLALPFPVRIHQRVGKPIVLDGKNDLREDYEGVTRAVQALIDELRLE